MQTHSLLTLSLLSSLMFVGCRTDEPLEISHNDQLAELLVPHGGPAAFSLPREGELDAIPQDPRNPLTAEKIELGRLLFHETAIGTHGKAVSAAGTFSCASCHFAGAGFQAGTFQGIGEGGDGFGRNGEGRRRNEQVPFSDVDVQPIRSPSALNTAYQEAMLWNGQFGGTGVNAGTEAGWTTGTPKANNYLGYQGLETQAIAGLTVHRLAIDAEFAVRTGYDRLFRAAFPQLPDSSLYSAESAGLAIAAYERTLLADEAPWQRYLRGDDRALTDDAREGAVLFFGKAGCVDCHAGPALNSMTFHALGMADLVDCPEPTIRTAVENPENLGRGGFTGRPEDAYKFKVPQLYNLKSSPFYGHGSSFRSVRDVIAYKNQADPENVRVPHEQLADGFRPLGLTDVEIDRLTAFIEDALYDPALDRYVPGSLPSGQCFPNHDEASRHDLGCD